MTVLKQHFFSGKIDALLDFYTKYKTKKEYYLDYKIKPGVTSATLHIEGKFKDHYDGKNFKVFATSIPKNVTLDRYHVNYLDVSKR